LPARGLFGKVIKILKSTSLPEPAAAVISDLAYERYRHNLAVSGTGSSVGKYGRIDPISAQMSGISLAGLVIAMDAKPRNFKMRLTEAGARPSLNDRPCPIAKQLVRLILVENEDRRMLADPVV